MDIARWRRSAVLWLRGVFDRTSIERDVPQPRPLPAVDDPVKLVRLARSLVIVAVPADAILLKLSMPVVICSVALPALELPTKVIPEATSLTIVALPAVEESLK